MWFPGQGQDKERGQPERDRSRNPHVLRMSVWNFLRKERNRQRELAASSDTETTVSKEP